MSMNGEGVGANSAAGHMYIKEECCDQPINTAVKQSNCPDPLLHHNDHKHLKTLSCQLDQQCSPPDISQMSSEHDEESLTDEFEFECQPCDDKRPTSSPGTDHLHTLGEILMYCQIMYSAIQRLDEKFEQLQVKVTNVQVSPVHQSPHKTRPEPDSPAVKVDPPPSVDAMAAMPQLVRVGSQSPPPSGEGKRPPALSPAPGVPSPPRPTPQSSPRDQGTAATCPSKQKTRKAADPEKKSLLGDRARQVYVSAGALKKAKGARKPRAAVRLLLRAVFTMDELTCSNTLGDASRGLKKLDPNRISAIREFVAKWFPNYDLKERGEDWKKCLSTMNSAARSWREAWPGRTPGRNPRRPAAPSRRGRRTSTPRRSTWSCRTAMVRTVPDIRTGPCRSRPPPPPARPGTSRRRRVTYRVVTDRPDGRVRNDRRCVTALQGTRPGR
ncbi:uncharacterized protein LOC114769404 isoform X2 [Denticeps clupeoides]|uniref:uncharacterized protein LOC114769404 isoform X2 n=1 Tax=Denticeps clupeoides TaxID=299321 RepID=UPI0010A3E599|nr:uncharacterized protein LOC114769404 isoform X2 [Denticeps clupeoides]